MFLTVIGVLVLSVFLPSAGPKPVQNSWDGEMTMPAPSNWGEEEEEEVEIGMWNNNTPQEVNQSGNWSYSKKVPPKVAIYGCVPDSTVCLACDGRHESLFYSLGYFSRLSVKKCVIYQLGRSVS